MKFKIVVLFIFVAFLASCNGSREQNCEVVNLSKISIGLSPSSKVQVKNIDKRKLIKNGELSINVVNVNEARQKIDKTIKELGGYCDREEFYQTEYGRYGDVNEYDYFIRIPAEKFELLISTIESGNNKVLNKTIATEDVTEKYYDNEMHLNNQRAYVKRYVELLKKALNVKDIIEIQTKIDGLEAKIDSLEGSLKHLDDQIAYSTLKVSLIYKRDANSKAICKGSYFSRLGSALKSGAIGFVDSTVFIVNIWPFWIVLAVAIYVWRKVRIRRKLRKSKG